VSALQATLIIVVGVLLEIIVFKGGSTLTPITAASKECEKLHPPLHSLHDLGLPPLPLVEEAMAVVTFAMTGIDDVVEDVAKFACTSPPIDGSDRVARSSVVLCALH
jgi:hypothetical protein